jgi:ESF2/ABP1 family protein
MKSKTSGNKNKFSTISHQLDERFNMDGFDLQAEESKTAVEETTQEQQQQRKLKPLSREKLEAFKERHDNTGVVYMSRVPPAMKPQKVRHLLSQFGEIGRIYLAAEGTHSPLK